MTLQEAMHDRHMVRKYMDKPIEGELIQQINRRISENNVRYGLSMKFVTNNTSGFNALIKLILAKGVKNFVILAGDNQHGLDEKLGYCGTDIMLFAQTLGLNTWWVGGTFNRNVGNMVPGKKVIGIIAVGYGATQGVPHKSKSYDAVAHYNGEIPSWFKAGVEAALLAPTALNKQDFTVEGNGKKVKIYCNNSSIFSGADLGIVKYHFELGAGTDSFVWDEAQR